LEKGRWLLGRTEFEFAYQQAKTWLEQPERTVSPDQLALADAAEALWQEWQVGEQPSNARGRRIFRSGGQSVLALTRSSPDRVAALLIGPRFLQSEWLQKLPAASGAQPVEFALTDADGQPVLGHPDVPLSRQSIRPASATQLPWTLHAISGNAGARPQELSGRTRLLLAGIAMMTIMLIAGGLFIHRAISRDIMVAQLQSDFVAAVSHEFRTPLTTLRQLSEMLVRGRVSSEERRQQFYETLLHESERLQRLIEALLNFGAMESGKLQYRFEPLKPDTFLQEVISDFEHEVSALGYHVELHENGALPAIRADRESLARVFWNLLDNAVKYSPESRTIWVDMSNGGNQVIVRVRDQGLGIPVAEQQEIFRKFVRGAASKNASIRGTGIGLAVARQIVVAHGGEILVESSPGQGSIFTVLLPVMEA
jgi:signal transduction histidine kinase